MSKDYYKTLGVEKSASQDEIKKAFRKEAHKYHPDKKDGNEAKFKEANEAYQTLSNDQKRAQYDRFGSAGPNMSGGGSQGGFGGFQQQAGGMEFDLNDIFEGFFGGQGGGFGGQRVQRGRNIQLQLNITFEESIKGVSKKIRVPEMSAIYSQKKEVEVTIPAGIENGQQLRLQGYGEAVNGGQTGDMHIVIAVDSHPIYQKQGLNLVRNIDVLLSETLEGAKKEIETFDEKVTVKIPQGVKTGTVLRVRGKGISRSTFQKGDILLVVNLVIPEKLSKDQKKLVEELKKLGL